MRLRVRNFRKLEKLDWAPEGVCLLVGPNGAGKTTTLQALRFLHTAWLRGQSHALRFAGGARALRTRGVPVDARVTLALGDRDITWEMQLIAESDGISPYTGERVSTGGEMLLDVPARSPTYTLGQTQRPRGDRAEIETLRIFTSDPRVEDLYNRVSSFRIYTDWWLAEVLRPTTVDEVEHHLVGAGRNLIPLLQAWKKAPRRQGGRFAWVLDQARLAFPDVIDDLEFERDGAALLYPPDSTGPDDALPLHLAPAGLIRGLLILAAVAGAPKGALVAIDDIEEALHPHAIRSLLSAVRARAEEFELTVVFTTHSPVVLNEFTRHPAQVFVLDAQSHRNPCPMDELENSAAWLALYTLGDLYEREQFGAPSPEQNGRR